MANSVAIKGKLKYDRENQWNRVERFLIVRKLMFRNVQQSGTLDLFSDENCVIISGIFQIPHSKKKLEGLVLYDALTKDSRIEVISLDREPQNDGDLVLFNVKIVPTATFNSYYLTNRVIEILKLWVAFIL